LQGTMGAIAGGMYLDGELKAVCSVGGGFTDEIRQEIWEHKKRYLGKVFEATGKSIFRMTTLRHPVFSRWRPDRLPKSCRPRA
jgi:ATP-dependent DNA ligase